MRAGRERDLEWTCAVVISVSVNVFHTALPVEGAMAVDLPITVSYINATVGIRSGSGRRKTL